MTIIKIQSLGGFEIYINDRVAELATRKARALLVYLAHAHSPRSRAQVSALLWGRSADEQARASLRQAISGLRKSLPDSLDLFEIEGETLACKTSLLSCDALQFELMAEAGDFDDLIQAAALYHGPFLDGFELNEAGFEDWLGIERHRYQDLAIRVFSTLGREYHGNGDTDAAIDAGHRLMEIDPLYEAGHALLVECYLDQGRVDAAKRQLDHCRDLLNDQLGTVPGPELQRLDHRISTTTRPTGVIELAAKLTADSPPALASNRQKAAVVVIPFQNAGGPADNEYFSDGIAGDLINGLSRNRMLLVISRQSSFTCRERPVDLVSIRNRFKGDYLVDGRVERRDRKLAIEVELIKLDSETVLSNDRHELQIDQIFEVQDELVGALSYSIGKEIIAEETRVSHRKHAWDINAWDLVLQAHWNLMRFDARSNHIAKEKLGMALKMDPTISQGYSDLALCHVFDALSGWSDSVGRSIEQAQSMANQALAIDDRDGWSHAALGFASHIRRQHRDALRHYSDAVAINPSLANGFGLSALTAGFVGELDEANRQIESAVALSPFDPIKPLWYNAQTIAQFVNGDYAEAARLAEKLVAEFPDYGKGYRALAASYGMMGKPGEARWAAAKLTELMPHVTLKMTHEQVPFANEADSRRYVQGLKKAGIR